MAYREREVNFVAELKNVTNNLTKFKSMRKLSKYFALSALCLGSFLFCACEKSNKDLLKDYKKVTEEMVTAIQDKKLDKIQELSKKGEKIEKELGERELSESEKEEKATIEAQMLEAVADTPLF